MYVMVFIGIVLWKQFQRVSTFLWRNKIISRGDFIEYSHILVEVIFGSPQYGFYGEMRKKIKVIVLNTQMFSLK